MSVQLSDGIALLSGAMFDYNNPGASNVQIEDIAAALSKVCRFSGHLPEFYSVAQHCVNTSTVLPWHEAYSGLMHDTSEAFTNDLPTPLKAAFPVFKQLEVKIETAMSRQFGFTYPLSPAVRLADLQMLRIEKEHLKKDFSDWDILRGVEVEHLLEKVDLRPWTPPEAEARFLARYRELH